MTSRRRTAPRLPHPLVALASVCLLVVFGVADVAAAHVTARATPADSDLTTVTFTFSHGCGTSPTTSLRVQFPEGTSEVTPGEAPAGWTAEVVGRELRWTGGAVPNDQVGRFTATMRLPGEAGEVVYLPTVQGCPDGEEAWIDPTPDPEATAAAPRVTLVATVAPAPETTATTAATVTTASPPTSPTTAATPGTTAAPTGAAEPVEVAAAPVASDSSAAATVVFVLATLAAVGVIAGGLWAARRRR